MKQFYKFKKVVLLLVVLLSAHLTVQAAGYQVLLQGNRATAMGNLGVGLRPDASSMFFNPGAMAMMEKNEVMLGVNLITANMAYYDSQTPSSTYTANTDNPMGTPFHAYAVWGPKESKFKFGLGAYTPYGSGVKWGNTWNGKLLLDEISLQAIYVQATASYKIIAGLSVGAGFVMNFGSVNLQRAVDAADNGMQTMITLDGKSDIGYGYNVGVYWEPIKMLQVGVSYRSQIDAVVNGGDVSFTNVPSSLSSLLTDNKFSATLPMPSSFNIGATVSLGNLMIGAEVNRVGWSAYKSLDIDFAEENIGVQDTKSPRNYEDTWVYHLGAEYELLNLLALRVGGYYDQTPVQDGYMTPETPDANRIGLTGGLGVSVLNMLQIDVSFLYITGEERTQTVEAAQAAGTYPSATNDTYAVEPGTYKLNAFIPGISLAFKF